jgi:hypothetical protein
LNGAPVRLSASHGRSDQLDHRLVPITISMARSFVDSRSSKGLARPSAQGNDGLGATAI